MAAVKNIEQLLAEHEFLAGMDPSHIAKIAPIARLKIAEAGEFIFRIGELADCCYLIRDGLVAIELHHASRGPVVLQTVGAQRVLGWSWMLPPYKWTFDGRALQLTRGICIDAICLRELCMKDHEFGYEMLWRFTPIISERLEAARLQLLDLFGTTS